MKYLRTKILYAFGMYGGALLGHSLLWFIYEKLDFNYYIMLFAPLILCMMYHFSLKDCGKGKTVSKGFASLFMAVLPFITLLIANLYIYSNSPEISIFNTGREYGGTLSEFIALYSGRAMVSSVYVIIVAIIEHIYLFFKGEK